jgi:hypothetical protein
MPCLALAAGRYATRARISAAMGWEAEPPETWSRP